MGANHGKWGTEDKWWRALEVIQFEKNGNKYGCCLIISNYT
jgi:hypothetical protein